MKLNQQEEILKAFENCKYVKGWGCPIDKYESGEYTCPDTQALFIGFKEAYTLQQEKIDKLEKELAQQKFNNAHNLSIDQQIADKIESLKSDLGEATTEAISWLEKVETERCCNGYMCGCLGKPTNREYYDLQRMKEIRQRHCLDKSEEV